jgi:hypothetical protein
MIEAGSAFRKIRRYGKRDKPVPVLFFDTGASLVRIVDALPRANVLMIVSHPSDFVQRDVNILW